MRRSILEKRDLGLGLEGAVFSRYTGLVQASEVTRPGLRQEQAQGHRHGNLALGQGERDERLAVRVLAQNRGILGRDPDRMAALLRQGCVVNDQVGIRPTHQPVGLGQEFGFERRGIPAACGDEMVEPVMAAQTKAARHRLHTLALARADQTRHVERAHHPPRRVREPGQERLKPPLQVRPPACTLLGHGTTPRQHDNNDELVRPPVPAKVPK